MIKGAGVLPYCSTTKRYLLNLRSKNVNEPLTWCLWGGGKEYNETFLECAKREFKEESGYTERIILTNCYTYRNPYIEFYNYILIMDNEFTPTLSEESNDGQWYFLEDITKLRNLHFGLKALLNSKEFYHFIEDYT